MDTLIIPDVHERIRKLRQIRQEYSHIQKIVYLGDFFDSYDGVTDNTKETISYILDNIDDPNQKWLLSNHDAQYAYHYPSLKCPGYEETRAKMIKKELKSKHWDKFKLHTWVDQNWLLTHAGWHPNFLHPYLGFDRDALQKMEDDAIQALRVGISGNLTGRGRVLGGTEQIGGVYWLNWDEEFTPIAGLNQAVGHTNYPNKVRSKFLTLNDIPDDISYTTISQNYCIDTGLRHVAIIEDNQIRIDEMSQKG